MREFIHGIRTPLVTTFSPASATKASKAAVNFESRSRIRNLAVPPASSESMRRLRPNCTIHSAVGCAVAPRTRTRLVEHLLLLVRPDTLLRWRRDLLSRRHAATCAPRRRGRGPIVRSVRALLVRLARENSSWGYCRTP
ncbi:hypothetical protein GCM10009646_83940 [Streptomyces aureus]